MERRLNDYLPFVVREYAELQGITESEQPEFEKAWDSVDDLLNNQFIPSAGNVGLSRWEGILGIHPRGTDTLEERRFRIKTRWNQGQLPYTYRTLQQYLATVSEDFETRVDHNAYALFLRVRLSGYRQRDELFATLRRMIPANMTFTTKTEIPQKTKRIELTAATGVQTMIRYRHRAIRMESAPPNVALRIRFAVQTRSTVQHNYKGV